MSENTKIEWCDHTFNPWVGCTKISLACDHCYAEGLARRSGQVVWGGDRKRTSIANWRLPIKWNKCAELMQRAWDIGVNMNGGGEVACIEAGFYKPVRPKVFCASLADVFDNAVPVQWRADLFRLIADTPNLDWLLLTKRIGNAEDMITDAVKALMIARLPNKSGSWPWSNAWLGATICNQAEADRDIPKLLAIPAHKRFLSMEPLLGSVDISRWLDPDAFTGCADDGINGIDWVIVGGESGPNARPMHPDWARSLRDQCEAAGVPFLFKQWGEFVDIHGGRSRGVGFVHKGQPDIAMYPTGRLQNPAFDECGMVNLYKVGKKAAGRLLDGREWNGVPA